MRTQLKKIICSMAVLCCMVMTNIEVIAAPISGADSAIIQIDSYEVEEENLIPGEEITLKLSVKNNSSMQAADNIVMTYDVDNNALYPIYGEANQVYIGSIAAGAKKNVTIKAIVNKSYNADYAKMDCEFVYASAGTVVNNNVSLNIPTYVAGNLISESVVVSGNAVVGGNSLVSIRCKNGGTTDVTDARLIIDGNVSEENKEIMLPMIGAGKTYIQDCNITFVESGIQTLNIQYKYSDANGNEYVLECGEHQVNVTDTIVTSAENMVSVEQVGNVNTFMMSIVLIVASLIAIVVAVAVYIKKYR